MKLVEILADKLKDWADTTVCYVQDPCGTAWPCGIIPNFDGQSWVGGKGLIDQSDEAEMLTVDLSNNYSSSIVTRAQWQAERDKQKGGEWKRHRGGKQPVADGTHCEYRYRDGTTLQGCNPELSNWNHYGSTTDIMAFRVISQPQAEEVEVNKFCMGYKCQATAENIEHSKECLLEAELSYTGFQIDQIDGPLKWRDTIIHCQAIIEDCEREIQRNVDLLDAEGLMMQKDSKKAMQHYAPDALPFAAWQAGDIVTSISDCSSQFTAGKKYEVLNTYVSLGDDRVSVVSDDKGHENGWSAKFFVFHSRP